MISIAEIDVIWRFYPRYRAEDPHLDARGQNFLKTPLKPFSGKGFY